MRSGSERAVGNADAMSSMKKWASVRPFDELHSTSSPQAGQASRAPQAQTSF